MQTTSLSSLPSQVRNSATEAALNATDVSINKLEISTPNMSLVTYAPLLGKIVVLFFGGFLVSKGIDVNAWTGENWVLIFGVALSIGGVVWAWLGRIWTAWREHQIAKASAAASAAATVAAGKPTEIAIQPPATRM